MESNRTGLCVLALSLGLAATAAAQEQGVKAKNVPAAVTASAAKLFPTARVVGWAKETEDGKTFYEAEMKEGSTKRDVIFTPDGKLDLVEEEIPTAQVPTAVLNALKTRYAKARIDLAEKLTRGRDVQYELHVKKAPKREVVFTPEGKFVKEE